MHYIQEVIKKRRCMHAGLYSACTANAVVLEAVMEAALQSGGYALVEATANQVNQYGGYTGMKPQDFANFVYDIADRTGMPRARVILGGDHLGPLTWRHENEETAMEKAAELIRMYVTAGFTKIHFDTSMKLSDDHRDTRLADEVIARRCAYLANAAEEAYLAYHKSNSEAEHPVYVVGSEVPIPGGAQHQESLHVTTPSDFRASMSAFRQALTGIAGSPWDYVVAAVVQPGVEFGDESIDLYDRVKSKALTETLQDFDGIIFEGHSTDYQPPALLRQMVEDGVAILKVGPALTFYLREGYFALEMMEKELISNKSRLSCFSKVLDAAMCLNPENWSKHYEGTQKQLAFKRKYSFSDRCRYYLPDPSVAAAADKLIKNLRGVHIPLSLISQYMPIQFEAVRTGALAPRAEELLKARVRNCIDDYLYAVRE